MSLEKTNTDRNDNCAPAKLVNVSTNLEDVYRLGLLVAHGAIVDAILLHDALRDLEAGAGAGRST